MLLSPCICLKLPALLVSPCICLKLHASDSSCVHLLEAAGICLKLGMLIVLPTYLASARSYAHLHPAAYIRLKLHASACVTLHLLEGFKLKLLLHLHKAVSASSCVRLIAAACDCLWLRPSARI